MAAPENRDNTQSGGNLFKLHEVSILDLDKEGSLLNDVDSDLGAGLVGRVKANLDGELGENGTESKPLLHAPSNKTDLDRGSDIENRLMAENDPEGEA